MAGNETEPKLKTKTETDKGKAKKDWQWLWVAVLCYLLLTVALSAWAWDRDLLGVHIAYGMVSLLVAVVVGVFGFGRWSRYAAKHKEQKQ